MRNIFLILFTSTCSFGCNSNSAIQEYTLEHIDGRALTEVKYHVESGKTSLTINSPGGTSSEALKIGEYILSQNLDVKVIGECSSACAEYILPAARSITLVDAPAISIHGNEQHRLLVSKSLNLLEPHQLECFEAYSDWAKSLVARSGANISFFQETFEKLGEPRVEISSRQAECPIVTMEFNPNIWILGIEDLVRFLPDKEIFGETCADKPSHCKNYLHRKRKILTSALINGNVISKF